MKSLQGVLDAAEKTRSPVIIGFNGEFLTIPGRRAKERVGLYGALGRAAAETASVPCGFIFNECPGEQDVHNAVFAGFNLVMLSAGERSIDEYQHSVAALVQFAHRNNIAVEAELGELPSGDLGVVDHSHSSMTDPDQAARFVEATGVDLLSVSAGNIHVLMDGQRGLDLQHLERIRKRVTIPLGLHGGTGIPADSLRAAIQMGVAKVNYGTYLKLRYLAALRACLSIGRQGTGGEMNPHKLLGMGGDEDLLTASRLAVRDAVLERIEYLGCAGRA